MASAVLTISSKTYSSWSLRGWLICRLSGMAFTEKVLPIDAPATRAELLLLSPSFRVPMLEHDGAAIWDTLAIAEYLAELVPGSGILPVERKQRAHCRSISGEMHSGFAQLRAALPMNIKAHKPGFRVPKEAQPDIERIAAIWRECLATYDGPFLFGAPSLADAMYAPVCSRFTTYDVPLDPPCAAYRDTIMSWAPMEDWIAAAAMEPDDIAEFNVST